MYPLEKKSKRLFPLKQSANKLKEQYEEKKPLSLFKRENTLTYHDFILRSLHICLDL